jgi:hypothetical protein
MHLPRMVEKIRRHWAEVLAPAYRPTLGRGFDDLLCRHIGAPFDRFLEGMRECRNPREIESVVTSLLPADVRAPAWNRLLVQRGLAGWSRERLAERKRELGLSHREDILTMCDLLEVNEGRLE